MAEPAAEPVASLETTKSAAAGARPARTSPVRAVAREAATMARGGSIGASKSASEM
jgi:hypothetical protein